MNKGKRGLTQDEITSAILNLLCDLGSQEKVKPVVGNRSLQKWIPPPSGQLIINTEGAFVKETLEGGWGFIIRYHLSDVVAVGVGRLSAALDALTYNRGQGMYKGPPIGQ